MSGGPGAELSWMASGALATQAPDAGAIVVLGSPAIRAGDAGEPAGAELSDRAAAWDAAADGGLARALRALGWRAEPGDATRVPLRIREQDVVVVVVGVEADAEAGQLVEAAAIGVRAAASIQHVAIDVEAPPARLYREGVLATHAFTAYLSRPMPRTERVTVLVGADAAVPEPAELAALDSLLAAIRLTRDLVTLPAADTTPAVLAERLRLAALDAGAECTVYDAAELDRLGLRAVLAVGRGSAHPPVLVRLHAPGTGEGRVAVVGKGITYDAGGVNLKLTMLDQMKLDMAGGAAAAAAVLHAARHPGAASLTAWVPLAENVMSGDSYHAGDVIRMRSGLTVEVQNTDAEGRLVLADAMDLALEERPDRLLTIATLTGNEMLALGMRTAGLMTGDATLRADIVAAAETAAESIWPMPRLPYLARKLRSRVADLGNLGEPAAQMLIASLFLERFAGGVPFAHLDIAGPAYNHGDAYAQVGHGGTGFGVATLVALLERACFDQ